MSTSAKSTGTTTLVPPVSPPPTYFARSEASELITTEYERKVDVSQSALNLLNEFSDHVLYNLISTAHSVQLGALKAAVPAVLKPRLGKSALRYAEEELKDYMEDEEAEELYSSRNAVLPKSHFDPDLVWKLARLRCMVYARLGDFEEEDEEEWLEKEQLLDQAAASPMDARQSMAVTPGAAIFLTSIIEYLGEQALHYAAQYAQRRHETNLHQGRDQSSPQAHFDARNADIFLDGKDMNHVGRDSPLSRLWRSWRRQTRSPIVNERPMPPDGVMAPPHESYHNLTTNNSPNPTHQPISEEPEVDRHLSPSQIPLPGTDDDIEDIEAEEYEPVDGAGRPYSMPHLPGQYPDAMDEIEDVQPPDFQERSPLRLTIARTRSNSVPIIRTPFALPLRSPRRTSLVPSVDNASELKSGMSVVSQETPDDAAHASAVRDFAQTSRENHSTTGTHPGKRTPSPEELNTTVGVLAASLGAVGVHHVGKKHKHLDAETAQHSRTIPTDQPLTSASITGPRDFDMMYIPERRTSPDKRPKSEVLPGKHEKRLSRLDPFEEIRRRQLEEHKRYSQQSQDMDTPTIYAHRDHSPRFPKDMRRVSAPPASEAFEPVLEYAQIPAQSMAVHSVRASNTAPSRKLGPDPASMTQSSASATAHVEDTADSPVSPPDSSQANHEEPVIDEQVSDLPRIPHKNQASVDERTAGRNRGHSKSSSSSSRLLGFTRDDSGRPRTIYQQMAAGDMSDEMRRAHSSTPDAMNQARPATSHSTTSPRRGHLRLRADSENNVGSGTNEEIAKRSLEVLINSDETVLMSLTPPVATFNRDEVSSALVKACLTTNVQQVNASPKRSGTQDLADFLKNTAPPGEENSTPRPITRSRKVSLEAGRAPQAVTGQRERKLSATAKDVMLDKPPAPRTKNPIGVPRDAQVDRSSGIRDLADYVRSTGPSNDDQLPRPLTARATAPTVLKAPAQLASAEPGASMSPKPRRQNSRLQARDARPSRHAESSELIDFIREGPPRAPGDHRINRHVAPFRTTMDSDDLNGLVSSLPKDSSEEFGVPSIATTNNSNTPLVGNEARMGAASQSNLTTSRRDETSAETNGMPQRTRRRIKDPYAIDVSDDEDEDLARPKSAQEESLIDFLRNTAPPTTMATPQPLVVPPQEKKTTLSRARSIDKLKELVRATTPSTQDRPEQSIPPSAPRSYTQTMRNNARTYARAESPHLTQTGSKRDSYRATSATYAPHVERQRQLKQPPPYQKQNGLRNSNVPVRAESTASNNTYSTSNSSERRQEGGPFDTGDLADFFRNTGPPATEQKVEPFILNGRPNGQRLQSQDRGLKKFFSVRGKRS